VLRGIVKNILFHRLTTTVRSLDLAISGKALIQLFKSISILGQVDEKPAIRTWAAKEALVRDGDYTDISNNVCGVKAFFERRTARTPRSCFDSALVEELIIDDEGSHVICRAELGPTQTSLRSHVRP
jgi:hypothetical protein